MTFELQLSGRVPKFSRANINTSPPPKQNFFPPPMPRVFNEATKSRYHLGSGEAIIVSVLSPSCSQPNNNIVVVPSLFPKEQSSPRSSEVHTAPVVP